MTNYKSDFVHVNGIRLHYLDWGGSGPTLLFLTGMGSSAYIFNQFAPRFTDAFHVLALTRRGHGDSDYPETGYDADTLTEDIRQFMDALHVEKAILAGHSLAGVELTHFAATYPTLSFYAWKRPRLSNAYTEAQKAAFDQFQRNSAQPFFKSLISEFQNRFPHTKIIEIPDGHHYCFMVQEELVYNEIRNFLLK